jgi:hypothetical protein
MQIPRPSDADKQRFRELVPDAAGVEIKPMFGNLGAFVNGNMFAGLFGSAVGVRLVSEASLAELGAVDGVGPFGPAERPMGGYLALPTIWVSERHASAAAWIERARTEVADLPPKPAKKRPQKSR